MGTRGFTAREETGAALVATSSMLAAIALQAVSVFAQIRGRVLHDDGSPAIGAEFVLTSTEYRYRDAISHEWRAVANGDGCFVIEWLPTPYVMTLQLHESGFERAAWQWTQLDASCPVDLGEIVLQPGATIHGRFLIDDNHLPARSLWRISAWTMSRFADEVAIAVGASVARDATTGEFWISDLPGGKVRLSATRFDFDSSASEVQVEAGESIERDVLVDGLIDNDPGHVPVVVECAHGASDFGISRVTLSGLDHWILRGPQTVQEYFRPPPPPPGSFTCGSPELGISFGELDPGHYAFEVDDARFERSSTSFDVPCEEQPVLHLHGTSALRLFVRDADTGEQLRGATVELRSLWNSGGLGDFWPDVLHGASSEWPEEDLFDGLIAGDWKVAARADGYGADEVVVCDLAARETRWVEIGLRKLGRIHGRVVLGAGSRLNAPAVVSLFDPEPPPRTNLSPRNLYISIGWQLRYILRQVQVDASGEFDIDDAPAGWFPLRVDVGRGLWAETPSVHVLPGSTTSIELDLGPCAWLDGWIRGLEGRDGFKVRLTPHCEIAWDPHESLLNSIGGGSGVASVSSDASFHIGPLRPGEYDVWLSFPESRVWSSNGNSWPSSGPAEQIGTVLLPATHGTEVFDANISELSVRVRANELAPPVIRVDLVRDVDRPWFSVCAMTDANGLARFPSIASGRWFVSLWDPDGRWRANWPDPIDVRPGELASIELGAPLVRRTLKFVYAVSLRPLGAVGFWCTPSTKGGPGSEGVTDRAGEAVITLAIGSYDIRLKTRSWLPVARTWSDELPDPVVIVIDP
jgi:hypothetical protein